MEKCKKSHKSILVCANILTFHRFLYKIGIDSGIRKAAFLDGARQVGKTTAVRELARCHFDNFVEVNFIRTPMAKVDTGLVSHMMLKGAVLYDDVPVNGCSAKIRFCR